MELEDERQGQASLLVEHSAHRGRLWPTGRLRLACCLVLAAVLGAGLSTTWSPGHRAAGGPPGAEGPPPVHESNAATVPTALPAPPAPSGVSGEEALRPSIQALVRELHEGSAYRRAILEALSGAKKFVNTPAMAVSASYTRKCSFHIGILQSKGCSPPACSEGHSDLGLDCLYTGAGVCTRTCLVLTKAANSLPDDADGHPIVCGDDFAAVGPLMPPQLFHGTEKTIEFVAESTGFVMVDLWGGGGGGTGAVKAASSEDANALEVSIAGDSTYSGIYELKGATASGASWYQHNIEGGRYPTQSTYLYYDPDCSNHGFGEGWFFGASPPDISRLTGLDPNNRYQTGNTCSYRVMTFAGRNSVPTGQQAWYSGSTEVAVSIKFATTEAWVCGAGGGGAAHVKALLELQAGQTYRFELGSGGAAGSSGKAAQNGQATRLLQRTERLDWRVLAEAGGGFGAGQYNAAFRYNPGGQGGFSSPHRSHLETHRGHAGAASRSYLTGPSEILPPERLLGPCGAVCAADLEDCQRVPKSDYSNPDVCAVLGVRQPCGDVYPPRASCSPSSAPDWFLTCSSSFRLGSESDTSVMQCHGAAAVKHTDDGPGTYWSHQGPFVPKPSIFHEGPLGGSAVTGQGAAASLGAGHGGQGMCPVMRKPGGKLRAAVEGHAGYAGSMGAAMLSRCRRRGAYVLALQRCREGLSGRALRRAAGGSGWTLHGLWPEGSQSCQGNAFDLPALSELRPRLEASWPSCRGGQKTSEEFWRWEWEKHGTCFGADQRRYFQLSLELLERHATACAEWRTDDCRLCLTADFQLCAGLSDASASAVGV